MADQIAAASVPMDQSSVQITSAALENANTLKNLTASKVEADQNAAASLSEDQNAVTKATQAAATAKQLVDQAAAKVTADQAAAAAIPADQTAVTSANTAAANAATQAANAAAKELADQAAAFLGDKTAAAALAQDQANVTAANNAVATTVNQAAKAEATLISDQGAAASLTTDQAAQVIATAASDAAATAKTVAEAKLVADKVTAASLPVDQVAATVAAKAADVAQKIAGQATSKLENDQAAASALKQDQTTVATANAAAVAAQEALANATATQLADQTAAVSLPADIIAAQTAQAIATAASDIANHLTCYLSGSLIRASEGDVAVEDIRIGDEVVAFDWQSNKDVMRPVIWVGKAHFNIRHELPDDEAGYPIRVLKDAIADSVPYKDMLITAEHSLFFDGKFVPARMLVNGRSIFYDKSITSYDYYHIETEQHSVIMADGMLTESYLDTGNRHTFRQEGNVVAFTPSRNLTWDDAAAPLGVSREFAEPLFRQAEARAQAAGLAQKEPAVELTDEVNLHLVTDTGAVIRQAREHNGRVMFMIPTGVKNVRIVSNASRPSDVIGPFVDDRRYFGVAVGEITMFEAGQNHSVIVHLTKKELKGWNTLEWEDTRWTSGDALLPLGERHPNSAALLAIQIKKAGPYLASDSADIQSVKTA